jgi:hypothetical protein
MKHTKILALCLMLLLLALNPISAVASQSAGVFDRPQEAPKPTVRLTLNIVDEAGRPLSNVCGALGFNDGVTAMHIEMTPHEDKEINATDDTGKMYIDLIPDWIEEGGAYTLNLYAYYDHTMKQSYKIIMPGSSKSYKVIWKEAAPPKSRPPQTQGLRFWVRDSKTGLPVQGVVLDGSPYSNEAWAANKVLPGNLITLGPSTKNGYIRWDTAVPGTYELGGEKDGLSQHFIVTMPKDKALHDIVLNWKPEKPQGAGMSWPGE